MHDYDYYNTVALENRQQLKEERERRNEILRMTNPKRKQSEWNSLYPKLPVSDMVY